jgi:hypothetical protein
MSENERTTSPSSLSVDGEGSGLEKSSSSVELDPSDDIVVFTGVLSGWPTMIHTITEVIDVFLQE